MSTRSTSTRSGARIVAVKPLSVPAPDRGLELEVKVTFPESGEHLPVLVFSHGNAWSLDGYAPLVERWAAAGFVVVQPTHPDSRRHRIGFDDPRFPSIWRVRIADLHAILDHLDEILGQAGGAVGGQGGGLAARVNREHVAVVGHSWGAQTVGTLLGARVFDADGAPGEDFSHPAVTAGALIAATGTGDSLTPFAAEHLPFMRPDYSTMTAPALIIAGGKDQSRMSTRGPDWFTDAYHLSPAPKSLLAIAEGEHTLGGVAGEAVAETTDEDPARVALVADAVSAYLLDLFEPGSADWAALRAEAADAGGAWSIESR